MLGRCDVYNNDLMIPLHHVKQQADCEDVISSISKLELAIRKELNTIDGHPELFMRSSSQLTILLRDIAFQQGRSYFRYVLRDIFGDKSIVYTNHTISQLEICVLAKSIARRLAKAIHYAPLMLRACTQFVLREFQAAFPAYKNAEQLVVGSILFLRVLCPALIKPETFGFQPHTPNSLPKGVQIARLLQTALRGGKQQDSTMSQALIESIQSLHPFLATFLAQFPQITNTKQVDTDQSLLVYKKADELSSSQIQRIVTWEDLDVLQNVNKPKSPGRLRGMSLHTHDDLVKQKKKFSLKFWR